MAGANPSAEGEDAEEGGDAGEVAKALDIEDQFRLNKIEGGMDKKTFSSDLKGAFMLPSQGYHSDIFPSSLHKATQQYSENETGWRGQVQGIPIWSGSSFEETYCKRCRLRHLHGRVNEQ